MLKAVTGDSDHYPLLADIPLDNISFVPPGPELPQPDRTARIKWPATQKQLQDYKMQTEIKVGQAARKEAEAMREAIKMADETIGNKSPTERLRLNKEDELRAAGLTKEMVLNHASKVSEMLKDVYDNVAHEVFDWTKPGPAKPTRYRNRKERRRWKHLHKYRAELKQALDAYKSKPTEATDSWHEEVCEVVTLHRGKTSTTFQQHFPQAPESPCDAAWKQWAQTCATEVSRATAAQREAQKAHDQQSIENQIKKTESGYMRNQKKTHKMGRKGSFLIIADVGTAATLGNLGVHHKRIPKWVLPNNMLALHTTDPDGLRTKLRPDIMMVELQEQEQSIYQRAAGSTTCSVLPSSVIDPRLGRGRQRKIWIVEGGYCADTRYAEKVTEKNEQHEKLVDMLKMYGYDVQLRPMPLGYAGTIYKCNLSMLQDLGLQRTVAKNVLKKVHTHAIMCLHNIMKERRYLESNGRYALQARGNKRNNGAG